jgi:hypothetical protein
VQGVQKGDGKVAVKSLTDIATEIVATREKPDRRPHATKESPSQNRRWLVMFQMPGSRWAYVATTMGSGSTMNPDEAFDFGSRDAAKLRASEMQGPRSSLSIKVISRPGKSLKPLATSREAVAPLPGVLETAITKAQEKAEQSHHRQSIWLTKEGEFRIRPMFEKVSPLWTLVQHVPSED